MNLVKLIVTILLAIMIIVDMCEILFTIREILSHKKGIVDDKDRIEDTEYKRCKEELKCMFEEGERGKNMDRSDLAARMKRYEQASKTYLTRRMPVVMRIDGKAFHTFTRGFKRPFDDNLRYAMKNTMKYLCENIQGCVLGYTQSDEITLVLVDYRTHTSEAWFDYNVQKMCSVGSSMATMAFNRFFSDIISTEKSQEVYAKVQNQAMFDCRVFNVPKEDVCNNLIWRQLDATRNSIQLVGQANFSQKELHGKNCDEIQDMLMVQKGINWNNYPAEYKRGVCCIKEESKFNDGLRSRWVIDLEIPIFTQHREYIEDRIMIGE